MNKNAKLSMMARRRRKDGTFMEYMGMNPYDLYEMTMDSRGPLKWSVVAPLMLVEMALARRYTL